MTLARGRILPREVSASELTVVPETRSEGIPQGKLTPAVVVEAHERAAKILEEAKARAEAMLAEAELSARDARARAVEEGRAEGAAALAAGWMRLRAEEGARRERDLEQTLNLARMIAERLVGESLALDPGRIVGIARQALGQARRAHRIRVFAHPDDVDVLAREKAGLGLEHAMVEFHADPSRPRGSLRLETDLGILDADLAPQLDRLIEALRDGLRAG